MIPRNTAMTPDEIQRTMDFILQSQADSTVRMSRVEESHKQLKERQDQLQNQQASSQLQFQRQDQRLQEQIDGLAAATRDLVEVSRHTLKRLDHLET